MMGQEEQIRFCTRIADISFKVVCYHTSTRQLCRDYLIPDGTDCQETIRITPEDLQQERQRMLKKADRYPEYLHASDASVESMHLCRRIAEILPKYDRILFHSSALAIDGQAVLFTATSGTGKSTHARLWREVFGDRVEMINDDKPILHVTEDTAVVYGSPWRGKHGLGSNTCAPIKAVCQICRDSENKITDLWSKEFFPVAMQQTYAPEDLDSMIRTVRAVSRLIKQTGIYRICCNMEPDAAKTAYDGIYFD